jgi:hypothetical protein
MRVDPGLVGVWLLIGSGIAIVVEGVLAAVWGFRVGKGARRLAESLETERGMIEADLNRLRLAVEETRRLWKPYRRILRWLRHPLVVALLQSYARRRVAVR